jgi:NarL family two-component system response regulator LiaR
MAEPKVAGVLLVDDHTLYREGLRELIRHWAEFEVIGEAANGQEAIELCRRRPPDIVLMDIQMPVMDGVEATRLIHQEFPATAVVMLTVSAEEKHLFEAISQGARGYVLKIIPARQLRDRLRGVLQGEAPLSGAVAAKILDEFNRQRGGETPEQPAGSQDETLSEREIQILRLVAEGLSNEEIGARLFLSEQTVKKQLSSMLQKLHLNNRVQAAAYAVRKGLAD